MTFSLKLLQHTPCVSTIAQRRIKPLLSRLYLKKIQYLVYTY